MSKSKNKLQYEGMLEKAYICILLVIFGGIVLHAPISVGFGTLWPDYDLLIKSWKEILMAIAIVMAVVLLIRKRKISILREPLILGVVAYVVLHLIITIFSQGQPANGLISGLMIDLRYVSYFGLVYIAMRLFPQYRKTFVKVGVAGALVVMVFALLQVFVLPIDVLKYIGYNSNTIAPYLTVDQNSDFIRINSTLRGPNSLGAYSVMVIAGVMSWLAVKRKVLSKNLLIALSVLSLGGVVSLWSSYSRSALIAAGISAIIVFYVKFSGKINRKKLIIGLFTVLVLSASLFMFRDSSFVANVILHDNPTTGAVINSNDGHIESLKDGVNRLAVQPFGAGIGSTGSASLFGESPLIIENQYLFIAHEVGWLGLFIFCIILIAVFKRLWRQRSDWLALAVFASGIGMLVINFLLPIWVDDTISIVWWGLAAIVIGSKYSE